MKFHFPHNKVLLYCVGKLPRVTLSMVHLWHKHEAESQGGAEYYEHRDEHEGGVPLLLQDG